MKFLVRTQVRQKRFLPSFVSWRTAKSREELHIPKLRRDCCNSYMVRPNARPAWPDWRQHVISSQARYRFKDFTMTTPSTSIAETLPDNATTIPSTDAPVSMYDDIRAEFPGGKLTGLPKRIGGWLWRAHSDRPVRV